MKKATFLVLIIAALSLSTLACRYAGEILTPAEATQRAEQASGSSSSGSSGAVSSTSGDFQVDDEFIFTSTGFLIPMYRNPGDQAAFSRASRGSKGTVLEVQELNSEMWYKTKSGAGEGWVEGKYLRAVNTGAAAGTPQPTTESGTPAAPEGPQVGDTVYLVGKGFLINFVDVPGGKKITGNNPRGSEGNILEITTLDGVTWYKLASSAGEGWVPADNISLEKPKT